MSRRSDNRLPQAVPQRAFGQVPRRLAAVHEAGLRVLAETGMRVLDGGARDRFRAAGARVDDLMVRLDPGMVAERLATVPARFRLAARNPVHDLALGGQDMVFASVGGPAYVMDLPAATRHLDIYA